MSNLQLFQNHEKLLSGCLRADAIDILYCPIGHVHVWAEYWGKDGWVDVLDIMK